MPDKAHAAKCPRITATDRVKEALSRFLPLHQVAVSFTTGVHSIDCAAPFSAQMTTIHA